MELSLSLSIVSEPELLESDGSEDGGLWPEDILFTFVLLLEPFEAVFFLFDCFLCLNLSLFLLVLCLVLLCELVYLDVWSVVAPSVDKPFELLGLVSDWPYGECRMPPGCCWVAGAGDWPWRAEGSPGRGTGPPE